MTNIHKITEAVYNAYKFMLSQNIIKLFNFYKDEEKSWSVKTANVFYLIT